MNGLYSSSRFNLGFLPSTDTQLFKSRHVSDLFLFSCLLIRKYDVCRQIFEDSNGYFSC